MVDGPQVGIFWWVEEELLCDAVGLAAAEPYGVALQHGGHFDFHQALQPATLRDCRFRESEYDHYPRGRVVYFPARRLFAVYIDRCLNLEPIRQQIRARFALTGEVRFGWDSHYRCAGCGAVGTVGAGE